MSFTGNDSDSESDSKMAGVSDMSEQVESARKYDEHLRTTAVDSRYISCLSDPGCVVRIHFDHICDLTMQQIGVNNVNGSRGRLAVKSATKLLVKACIPNDEENILYMAVGSEKLGLANGTATLVFSNSSVAGRFIATCNSMESKNRQAHVVFLPAVLVFPDQILLVDRRNEFLLVTPKTAAESLRAYEKMHREVLQGEEFSADKIEKAVSATSRSSVLPVHIAVDNAKDDRVVHFVNAIRHLLHETYEKICSLISEDASMGLEKQFEGIDFSSNLTIGGRVGTDTKYGKSPAPSYGIRGVNPITGKQFVSHDAATIHDRDAIIVGVRPSDTCRLCLKWIHTPRYGGQDRTPTVNVPTFIAYVMSWMFISEKYDGSLPLYNFAKMLGEKGVPLFARLNEAEPRIISLSEQCKQHADEVQKEASKRTPLSVEQRTDDVKRHSETLQMWQRSTEKTQRQRKPIVLDAKSISDARARVSAATNDRVAAASKRVTPDGGRTSWRRK